MKDIIVHEIKKLNPDFIILKRVKGSNEYWITDSRDFSKIGPFYDSFQATCVFDEVKKWTIK